METKKQILKKHLDDFAMFEISGYAKAIERAMEEYAEQLVTSLTEKQLINLHDIAKGYCYTTQDDQPTISRKGIELVIMELIKELKPEE